MEEGKWKMRGRWRRGGGRGEEDGGREADEKKRMSVGITGVSDGMKRTSNAVDHE